MDAWRAILLCTVAMLGRSPWAQGQVKPLLFYGSEHVLVDSNTAEGRDYLKRLSAERPTPVTALPVIPKGATLGNVSAPNGLGHYDCGTRSDEQLVVCVDPSGRLSYSDSLAALAFASKPTEAFVPSDELRQYLASLLARLPGAATRADLHISTAPCADACARQIRLEHRS
jgi:hypothetical protein